MPRTRYKSPGLDDAELKPKVQHDIREVRRLTGMPPKFYFEAKRETEWPKAVTEGRPDMTSLMSNGSIYPSGVGPHVYSFLSAFAHGNEWSVSQLVQSRPDGEGHYLGIQFDLTAATLRLALRPYGVAVGRRADLLNWDAQEVLPVVTEVLGDIAKFLEERERPPASSPEGGVAGST